jgi:hypothetical protein
MVNAAGVENMEETNEKRLMGTSALFCIDPNCQEFDFDLFSLASAYEANGPFRSHLL